MVTRKGDWPNWFVWSLFIGGRVLRLACLEYFKVLKTSSVSPVVKELKLDKTDKSRVVQSQVLKGWWILIPAVFKVGYEQLVPKSVVVERTKKAELFCGAVPVASVVCVSETQTLNCFFTAKVQDKTLLFTFLELLSDPIVCIVYSWWILSFISRPMVCAES